MVSNNSTKKGRPPNCWLVDLLIYQVAVPARLLSVSTKYWMKYFPSPTVIIHCCFHTTAGCQQLSDFVAFFPWNEVTPTAVALCTQAGKGGTVFTNFPNSIASLYLFICCFFSSLERALGKLHLKFAQGASGTCYQEGGTSAGQAAGSIHYYGWRADLPRLSLRVSWGLVRAPAPQVRIPSV